MEDIQELRRFGLRRGDNPSVAVKRHVRFAPLAVGRGSCRRTRKRSRATMLPAPEAQLAGV